jgi:predicted TIM-barrel fold metal-dependent hydrolase
LKTTNDDILAIDAVVNLWTPEALSHRPEWRNSFFSGKLNVDNALMDGISLDEMLRRMDSARIERAFLVAAKVGSLGHPATYHLPYELVSNAVKKHPDRFSGLAGVDPTEGMPGVRALERAVIELGMIGAHTYPHWFELAPDHARFYPYYAKCVELDIPIQMQVGQSLLYAPDYPRRSVGHPICLDAVACDFPELKIIGIHIGIPWADEMIAMAWKHKNVYIGTDAHRPPYWPESFKNYVNTYGQKKVIFGTDFPVLDFETTRQDIQDLNLKPTALRSLLRENAEHVYQLT